MAQGQGFHATDFGFQVYPPLLVLSNLVTEVTPLLPRDSWQPTHGKPVSSYRETRGERALECPERVLAEKPCPYAPSEFCTMGRMHCQNDIASATMLVTLNC